MIYVLLAVVLLILLVIVLLNINVNLRLHYDNTEDNLECTLSFLFIKYVILPEDIERKRRKEEKKRKKAEKLRKKGKKPKEKEKFSFSDMFKERGIRGFAEDMLAIVKGLWSLITGVLRRATLKTFLLRMNVAGEDAADTAVLYGYINAAVYPVISALLDNVADYDEFDTDIAADFSEDAQATITFYAHLKIKPVKLIGALLENRSSAENLLSAFGKNKKD